MYKAFCYNFERNALMPCQMWDKCDSILESENKFNNLKVNIHIESIYLK